MKLQINDAGSWRHVITFDSTVENAIRERGVRLVAIVNSRSRLRILDDEGKVKATCKGPDFTWCAVFSSDYIEEKRIERGLQRAHRIQQQIHLGSRTPSQPETD